MFAVRNKPQPHTDGSEVRRFVTDALRAGQPVTLDGLTQTNAQDLWRLATEAGAQPNIYPTNRGWIFSTRADFLH